MQGSAGAHNWPAMNDQGLESAARYYLWLAEAFPDLQNRRLAEIIAEAGRRGKPEILRQARTSISKNE